MSDKVIIKLGAGKGKLLPVVQEYLKSLGLPEIKSTRKLVHTFETQRYILEVSLLRWEDIKRYSDKFDMIIYGSDQWLESGHKSMISLKYFEQKNCRISLLVKKELKDKQFNYFKERKVATSYPNLAHEYLGIMEDNIVKISGSVEAAVSLGWADSAFDVVETGKSAEENGLLEYKTLVKFGAILATKKIEKMPLLENLGLIEKQKNGYIIAFDGLDGSGKTTIAKYLVQNPVTTSSSTVLITPYSGYIGTEAKALWKAEKYFEWATLIGKNHWKAPQYVNSIYDRSILTFMTDLIKVGTSDEEILKAIDTWRPLPDILFVCDILPEVAVTRTLAPQKDKFYELESLKKYYELYSKAVDFIEKYKLVKIVRLNTDREIEEIIKDVKMKICDELEYKAVCK